MAKKAVGTTLFGLTLRVRPIARSRHPPAFAANAATSEPSHALDLGVRNGLGN